MVRLFPITLLIASVGLGIVACGDVEERLTAVGETERMMQWTGDVDDPAMPAEAAYQLACASCHETGANGAPITGDRDAWVDRSPLWEAVLAEHAKNGYMNMPAKGGVEEMPDSVVSRATEYMMLRVYPERPPD